MNTERIRTLIIDDEEFVRLVVEQALREEGCDTRTASGGQAGLDLLRTGDFDCVSTHNCLMKFASSLAAF